MEIQIRQLKKYAETAANLLNQNGIEYTDKDVVKVASFLIERQAEKMQKQAFFKTLGKFIIKPKSAKSMSSINKMYLEPTARAGLSDRNLLGAGIANLKTHHSKADIKGLYAAAKGTIQQSRAAKATKNISAKVTEKAAPVVKKVKTKTKSTTSKVTEKTSPIGNSFKTFMGNVGSEVGKHPYISGGVGVAGAGLSAKAVFGN